MQEAPQAAPHAHDAQHGEPSAALDGAGVVLSVICLIHCLSAPLLIGALPAFAWALPENVFHIALLVGVLPVGVLAFAKGYRRHGDLTVVLVGAVGLTLLVGGTLIAHSVGELAETLTVAAGTLTLAWAHLRNWR